MDAMKNGIGGEVAEANLREALGLSRVEMKKLRAKAPAGGCYQSGEKQGGKPKALWPWYWNKEAVAWLSKEIGLQLEEKKEMESNVKEAYVVVTKCSFPNKRIFEAQIDDFALMMIQCKDSRKLRPKQRVKVKFSNGVGYLVSDRSGRAK
jgi:hypothetical protein